MLRNSQIREAYEASTKGVRRHNLVFGCGTEIYTGKNRLNPKQRPIIQRRRLESPQPR